MIVNDALPAHFIGCIDAKSALKVQTLGYGGQQGNYWVTSTTFYHT